MKKNMIIIAVISAIGAFIFTILYVLIGLSQFLTLAISFGVTSYHFIMRLIVGLIYNILLKNKADYNKKWYQIHNWEKKLYKKIKVKKWKNYFPTFQPELFDTKKHSLDEIAQAMCQAELVHETIIILSFTPIVLIIWFGSFPVFLITSILAAAFDLCFVIMQRFNRNRIIRLIQKT